MTIMHQASSRWRRRCIHWKVLSSFVLAANPKIVSAFQPSSVRSVHHLDDSSSTSSSFNNYYCRRQRTGRRNHPSCWYESSTSPGSSSSRSVTACHLFFRKSSEKSPATSSRGRLTPEIYQDLQASDVRLPFEIVLGDDNEGNMNAAYTETLSIRFMTVEDIVHIMPLCIDEFGTGFTLTLLDFPWGDWSQISNWWDRVLFEPMVQLSLRSKMNANLPTTTTTTAVTEHGRVRDPAVMVLCRKRGSNEEEVVGMVELSLQAPEADKNPPPFPVPLFIKALYCRLTGLRMQGWVTNLLIDPRCRGLGYSKILMAVSEGIAKSWGCQYVFLHADADYKSGKVAQGLYKGLGYEVVMDDDGGPEYAWMMGGAQNPFSSIRMIEGVPLLCFKKELY